MCHWHICVKLSTILENQKQFDLPHGDIKIKSTGGSITLKIP